MAILVEMGIGSFKNQQNQQKHGEMYKMNKHGHIILKITKGTGGPKLENSRQAGGGLEDPSFWGPRWPYIS
jgi:hypothetical protein